MGNPCSEKVSVKTIEMLNMNRDYREAYILLPFLRMKVQYCLMLVSGSGSCIRGGDEIQSISFLRGQNHTSYLTLACIQSSNTVTVSHSFFMEEFDSTLQ